MIRSFADRETETVWSGRRSRKLPPDIQAVALRKLRYLIRPGCWMICECRRETVSRHSEATGVASILSGSTASGG